jgi:hypothetical protein
MNPRPLGFLDHASKGVFVLPGNGMYLACLGIGNVPGIKAHHAPSLGMYIEHDPPGFSGVFMENKLENFHYKFLGSVIIVEKHHLVIPGLLEFLPFFRQYPAFALYPDRHNTSLIVRIHKGR